MSIPNEDLHDGTVGHNLVEDAISAMVLGAVAPVLFLAVSRINIYGIAVSIVGLTVIMVIGYPWIIKGLHATNGEGAHRRRPSHHRDVRTVRRHRDLLR